MYSVVLATMLAAGSSTPAWHHGCHGCHGCYSCHSCYSGYSGYSGYGCYGCHGCHGCFGFGHRHHCYSSCYSCYSSCYCSGCYSYSMPVYSYGCYCSNYACCGGSVSDSGPRVYPVPNADPDAIRREIERLQKMLEKEKVPAPGKKEEVNAGTRTSRVTVTLPAEARLWIDNVECPLTSGVRSFNTPALPVGQQFVYTVRMEVTQNGQRVTQSHRAIITPGQPVNVNFNDAAQSTVAR